jgi:hypothetical protein
MTATTNAAIRSGRRCIRWVAVALLSALLQLNKVFVNGRLQRWPGVSGRHPGTRARRQGRGLYEYLTIAARLRCPDTYPLRGRITWRRARARQAVMPGTGRRVLTTP